MFSTTSAARASSSSSSLDATTSPQHPQQPQQQPQQHQLPQSWRSRLEQSMSVTRSIRGSNYVQLATVHHETGEPRCRTVVMRGFVTVPEHHAWFNVCDNNYSCLLQMCTDARSNKVQEQPQGNTSTTAELVWWFPSRKEQYRIRGALHFVGADKTTTATATTATTPPLVFETNEDEIFAKARLDLWAKLSDPARESFYQVGCPGQAYTTPNDNNNEEKEEEEEKEEIANDPAPLPVRDGRDADGKVVPPPPDNFVLVVLNPNYVDYLRLGGTQYRQIDQKQQPAAAAAAESSSSSSSLLSDDAWSNRQRVNP
ncbi:hypothetical protein ACA910_015691 [Epithemia clementina (nom. ined.)]